MAAPATLEEMRRGVAEAVRRTAGELFDAALERVVLERPPRIELGDLASPAAFDLAKSLRKPPRSIATELATAVKLPAGVARVGVEGAGYLNFFLDRGSSIAAMSAPPVERSRRAGR